MRQTFEALQERAARVGVKVNVAKTKEMRIRYPANTGTISYAGESLERVKAFTYLAALSSPLAAQRKMLRPDAGRHKLLSPF